MAFLLLYTQFASKLAVGQTPCLKAGCWPFLEHLLVVGVNKENQY